MSGFGVQSIDALFQIAPQQARMLERARLEGRQQAWEAEQQRSRDEATKQQQQQQEQQRFYQDDQEFQRLAKENFGQVQAKNPKLGEHFEKAGVNNFISHLEKAFTVPRHWLLSNPETVQFLAKAAEAMDTLASFDTPGGMREKIANETKAAYEKQKEAALMPAGTAGTSDGRIAQSFGGSPRRGTSLITKNRE